MDGLKQLAIKTGSVRRLGADHRSYGVEHAEYCRQLEAASRSGDGGATRRAREFVDECGATRLDIGLRLHDACAALDAFMADHSELAASQEWAKAQQTLQDNRPQPEQPQQPPAASAVPAQQHSGSISATSSHPLVPPSRTVPCPPPARFSVAVYGGSQAKPGDVAYERAKQLGAALAQHHFHIVSGGYGGVMEAVSVGASSVSGASIEGIISPAAFPFQGAEGNRYLTHRTFTNDLPHRIVSFLSRCQAFVVLPGGLGTLTELCLTWNVSAVTDLQPPANRRPLCLLVDRQPWQAVIEHCRQLLPISEQFMSHVTYCDTVDDMLSRLQQARAQHQQRTAVDGAGDAQTAELTADEKSYG